MKPSNMTVSRQEAPTRTALVRLVSQFSRFTLVGVAGTAVHYGVMAVLIELLGVPPLPSSAAGFITSAVLSYMLNYRLTFASSLSHRRALPMFLIVGSMGLALNSTLVGVLTGPMSWHWLIAQACASIIVLCWNFAANRHWTFGRSQADA